MLQSRRGFLSFLGSGIVAAPAIVCSASLMQIRGIILPDDVMPPVSINSKLIMFREEMMREYVRTNILSPFLQSPAFEPVAA